MFDGNTDERAWNTSMTRMKRRKHHAPTDNEEFRHLDSSRMKTLRDVYVDQQAEFLTEDHPTIRDQARVMPVLCDFKDFKWRQLNNLFHPATIKTAEFLVVSHVVFRILSFHLPTLRNAILVNI